MSTGSSRYRIVESLGRGGMGEVFLADDTQLERKVAIKFLPEELQADPVARQRFAREAKSAAALDHPFICKIHEIAEIDGKTCIVMEHVPGQTLEAALTEGGVSPVRALEIATEVAEAMKQAHARRILHRDLKPSNLMLTADGHVKVMDFGLAKRLREQGKSKSDATTHDTLTGTGAFIGTPAYMSPEQILGGEADARSDIFSFGVVLYELLTGLHPFRKQVTSDTLGAILRDPPTPPPDGSTPADYAVFDKLLAKEPHDRYQSFDEVAVEVRRLRDETSGRITTHGEAVEAGQAPLGARRTPYVGRARENAELLGYVDQTIRGRGGIVLIGGEPGVGKTRLVEQVLEAAVGRRCLALTGRCYEIEGTAPFIPFIEMVEQCMRMMTTETLQTALGDAAAEVARLVPDLRRQFPDIPPPLELPPEQQRHYLFKNFAEFLERASRQSCLVVLIDDLQWADAATLLLLQYLAPTLGRSPVLILGTYRDVELDAQRPFAKTLETLNRKRLATRLNVERLPVEGVEAMLAALGGPEPPTPLVTGIYQETEGNPFFVEEVFQHLKEEEVLFGDDGTWRTSLDLRELEVPEGVRLVIGRRLERVSPESQRVLTFGAVVGRSFSLEFLEAIGDVTGDALLTALEEAEGAYLVVPAPGREPRWEFSHALIRQTLAAGLSVPRRQRLHLRVAEAIERSAGDSLEKYASDLAQHLYQAGIAADPQKTVRYMKIAGERGLETGAPEEALRLFDNALALDPDMDDVVRADLLVSRGRALSSLAEGERALADWQAAAEIYQRRGDIERAGQTCWQIAFVCCWRGDNRTAIPVARRGLEMVGDDVSATRCRLLAALAVALGSIGDVEESDEIFRQAITEAESLGDMRVLGQVLHYKSIVCWADMSGREWVTVGERSEELLRSPDDLGEWIRTIGWLSVARWYVGEVKPSPEADDAEAIGERIGEQQGVALIRMGRALTALTQRGDIDHFETFARWYLDWNLQNDFPWKMVGSSWLGLADFWRGQWRDARAHFDQSFAYERAFRDARTAWSMWCNLLMAKAYARDDDVLALLRDRRSDLPKPGVKNSHGAWALLLKAIEAYAVLGELRAAADLYPLAVEAIRTGTVMDFETVDLLQVRAGTAAAAGGQWDAAAEHFQTGLRQAHDLPHKLMQPECRRWYAQMLIDRNASGDRDKARTMLGEAVEMYQTLGMPRHVEMAKETLKEL